MKFLSWIKHKLAVPALASTAVLLSACGGGSDHPVAPPAPAPVSIVATAQGNPSLSSLVAAVTFASNNGDLVNLLSGTGTFTVFAPTNAAFDALAQELTGTTTARGPDLLVPANKDLLRAVLQYHVLGSKVEAAQIPLGKAITPVGGSLFKIENVGGGLLVTDGRNRTTSIAATNVQASNGVVHVLNRVILPADKNIVQTAAGNPAFSSLVAALQFASNNGDLVNLLSGTGTFTVFAPTNAAFDALAVELTGNAAAKAADILVAGNKDLVRAVLQYHVLTSRVLKADIPFGQAITPALGAAGGTFSIANTAVITDARDRTSNIIITDVFATNGVVHAIDKVILPRP